MSDDTGRAPGNVKRYHWERHLKAADAEPMTKLVGFVLATYANGDKGTNAHPGIENLRRDCGVGNERTIRRHLAKLVALGLIVRVFHASRAGRPGLADVYELRVPAGSTSGLPTPGQWAPESEPVDPETHTSVPSTNPVSHHSASLTLAHDKSRADTKQEAEDLREDITERLEAWATVNYDAGLDPEDHRLIEVLVDEGRHPRMIENMVKKRITEFESVWPSPHEVERDWAASADCPF